MTTTIIQTVQEQVLVDHTISTIVTQTTLVQTTLGIPGANGVMGIVAAETVAANATSNPAVPSAIALAAQQVLGRITGGHVKGLSIEEILTLLGISSAGSELINDANAAAQLATLGVTTTAAELGRVAGVTSAIQAQLDTKASFKSPADAAVFRLKTDAATGTLVADGAVVAPLGTLDAGTVNEVRVTRDAMYACMPQRTIPSPWIIGTGSPANLVTNGEFETNTTGWNGVAATLSRETGAPLVGTGSLKILVTGAAAVAVMQVFSGVVGHTYYMTAVVKSTAAAGRLTRMRILTGAVATGASVDASAAITPVVFTFTATATTFNPFVELVSGIADESLLVDSVVCYDLTAMNNRNLLTPNQSNAETDLTGMSSQNVTLTRNTSTPLAGAGDFKCVSTGGADTYLDAFVLAIGAITAVASGLWYNFQVLVKTVGCAAGRKVQPIIFWYKSDGTTLISSSSGTQFDAPTVATVLSVLAQAPAGAGYARLRVTWPNAVAGEILYADSLMIEFLPLTEWKRTALVAW